MSGVVNVWFYKGGGERLRWWTSGVVNVWGGERLILHWGWWMSEVVNVWGGERLRWWTSEVVNVWGGERLILHRGWWTSGVVNVWGGECLGGEGLTIWTHLFPRYEMSIRLKLMPSQGNDMLRIQESCGIFALRQKDSVPDLCVCCVSGELHHVLNMNQRQHPHLCFHN